MAEITVGTNVYTYGKITGLAGTQALIQTASGSTILVPQSDLGLVPYDPQADALASIKSDTSALLAHFASTFTSASKSPLAGLFQPGGGSQTDPKNAPPLGIVG